MLFLLKVSGWPLVLETQQGVTAVEDYLGKNIEALRRRNAPIFRWLTAKNPDVSSVQSHFMTNHRGIVDWQLPSGKGIFDAVAPQVAYCDWVPGESPKTSATIIVGCNLGYGVNQVLANTPDSHKVLVLEPRPEMLLACLVHTDYRPFLKNQKLSFIPPDRQFLPVVASQMALQYVFGNVFLRSDMPSWQLGPEYAAWSNYCKEALEDMTCNITTMRQSQDVMVRNELRNFARAMDDGGLSALRNQGQGIKAVVLGAGPSLARFAPLFARNPGSALYGCGFQTLPALRDYGLKPHFCMAVDHTSALKRIYDGLDTEWLMDIPLIYSRAIDPEVLSRYPGQTLPLWTLGGLGSNMPRGREVVLNAGGNVGVALVRFLVSCDVDQILLVGQDFAWQGENTHVAGHLSGRTEFVFDPEKHMTLKNRDGRTIYSNLVYVGPLRSLERDIQKGDKPVFNLYGGGAIIRGTNEVTWEEVETQDLLSSQPNRLEHFLLRLATGRSPRAWPVFESRSAQWVRSVRAVQDRLGRLFSRPDKHQEEIHGVLGQILVFLRQDSLYQPYLFKEILGVAGLVHAKVSYGAAEFIECRAILNKVVKKVEEVDLYLVDRKMRVAA
jgi:hypothetical protein